MLINKYYVIVHGLKITSLFKKKTSRAGSTHSGGWGTRKNSVPIPRGVTKTRALRGKAPRPTF